MLDIVFLQGARIIKASHFDYEFLLGHKIVFICAAKGVPRPRITWFKDGIELHAHPFLQVNKKKKFLNILYNYHTFNTFQSFFIYFCHFVYLSKQTVINYCSIVKIINIWNIYDFLRHTYNSYFIHIMQDAISKIF